MTKFQVINVCCKTNDVKILGTFLDYEQAISFLTSNIAEQFKPNDYLKCYHESKFTISIFEYYYVFPKRLIYKLHIIPFDDIE